MASEQDNGPAATVRVGKIANPAAPTRHMALSYGQVRTTARAPHSVSAEKDVP
jgi:hypothetical protein